MHSKNLTEKLWTRAGVYSFALFIIVCIWFLASESIRFQKIISLVTEFPGGESSWIVSGEVKNARWSADGVSVVPVKLLQTSMYRSFQLVENRPTTVFINVSANVSAHEVDTAEHASSSEDHESIFYLWFKNSAGKRVNIQVLAKLDFSHATKLIEAVVRVPGEAVSVHAGLLLRDWRVGYELQSLSLDIVETTFLYTSSFYVLLFIVLAYFSHISLRLIAIKGALFSTMAVFVVVALVVGLYLPGDSLEPLNSAIADRMIAVNSSVFKLLSVNMLAHLFGFALLALLVLLLNNENRSLVEIYLMLTLFVLFTEAIQRHVLDRYPSFFDVCLDLVGVAIGSMIWCVTTLINRLKFRIKQ